MTVTRDEATKLLDALVRIDSVTPWLIPGGAGEGEVARFMRDWLTDLGLEVTLEDMEPGRPNVIAWLRGSGAWTDAVPDRTQRHRRLRGVA